MDDNVDQITQRVLHPGNTVAMGDFDIPIGSVTQCNHETILDDSIDGLDLLLHSGHTKFKIEVLQHIDQLKSGTYSTTLTYTFTIRQHATYQKQNESQTTLLEDQT